jgi:Zn-dependent peptidase ImmA (M78 family)
LLLDGNNALSAIEVLKARMPAGVEQRAKSFAGEFLLPACNAAAAWIEGGRPFGQPEVEQVVVALTERFGVTRSVAAWKLEHGAALQDIELSAVLDAVAPYR